MSERLTDVAMSHRRQHDQIQQGGRHQPTQHGVQFCIDQAAGGQPRRNAANHAWGRRDRVNVPPRRPVRVQERLADRPFPECRAEDSSHRAGDRHIRREDDQRRFEAVGQRSTVSRGDGMRNVQAQPHTGRIAFIDARGTLERRKERRLNCRVDLCTFVADFDDGTVATLLQAHANGSIHRPVMPRIADQIAGQLPDAVISSVTSDDGPVKSCVTSGAVWAV